MRAQGSRLVFVAAALVSGAVSSRRAAAQPAPAASAPPVSAAPAAKPAEDYRLGPDSLPRPGVPQGQVIAAGTLKSQIFAGTERPYWIYVPAQYDPARAACVMVFQDGGRRKDALHVSTVFDNLIARHEMPVTIGVFVDPGVMPAAHAGALPRLNRSLEYDGLGDAYARFVLDELLPAVGQRYHLTNDPNCRAIAGSSSGGSAAFTAAWERPDAFRRVFSIVGTYVGLRGGDSYPILIRKSEPKPLRVFLNDGSADQDIYGGNWYLANQEMLSALTFAGYEVNHAFGDGGHNDKQAAAIFPDVLRWLWKDYPAPIKAGVGSKQPVMDLVDPATGWQLVAEGAGFADGAASDAAGNVSWSDSKSDRVWRIDGEGKTAVAITTGGNGIAFGPDGRLFVVQSARQRIVAYPNGQGGAPRVIASGIAGNDIAVSHEGFIWVTEPAAHRIWVIAPTGAKRVVDTGIGFPNGIALSPDQSLLYVSDTHGRFVYSFQVQADGGLAYREPGCHLHVADDPPESGADGMTVDRRGWLYVTTRLGVQVCDQSGRVNAILARPPGHWLAKVTFGGAKRDQLFLTTGDRVYRRQTKTTGPLPFEAPITPPAPRD